MNENLLSIIQKKNGTSFLGEGLHTFLNHFSYLKVRGNRRALKDIDYIYIDGILLVYALRLAGIRNVKRMSFDMTSLAPLVFKHGIENGKTFYFAGSTEGSIQASLLNIKSTFKGINVIGFHKGYFKTNEERKLVIDEICDLNPDVLIVGMGTVVQECFLSDVKSAGWNGTGYTCGGFFHQTMNSIKYYPELINRFHLRWFYRICKEPTVVERYTIHFVRFIFIFLFDVLRFKWVF